MPSSSGGSGVAELFNVAKKFSGEGGLRVMGWMAPQLALMTARRVK